MNMDDVNDIGFNFLELRLLNNNLLDLDHLLILGLDGIVFRAARNFFLENPFAGNFAGPQQPQRILTRQQVRNQ